LVLVQKLAALARVHGKRAVGPICARTGVSNPQAESYVRKALLKLVDDDYCHSDMLNYTPPQTADVYRYTDTYGAWYVKIYMEHSQVIVVSFHEPEHLLLTDKEKNP
jgi:hypothetical protein